MSKYAIATFIVCWAEGFLCYLIGYMVGITHDKRTVIHECVKTNADQRIQSVESVGNNDEIIVRSNLEPFRITEREGE